MNQMTKWAHKDEWHRRGKDFLVVVKHHTEDIPTELALYEGQHRWTVYAYIYPKHSRFESFSGTDMYQPAASALPLHGGPSLLRWHRDDNGNPTSVQVGADYNHYGDDEFLHYATAEDAAEVFHDADRLFQHLSAVTVVCAA